MQQWVTRRVPPIAAQKDSCVSHDQIIISHLKEESKNCHYEQLSNDFAGIKHNMCDYGALEKTEEHLSTTHPPVADVMRSSCLLKNTKSSCKSLHDYLCMTRII